MKKQAAVYFLIVLCMVMCPVLVETAQAQQASGEFTADIELRPRFELRNGFKAPIDEDAQPAAFTEQRSRLNLNYKSTDLDVRLSIQDVRIWGDHNQIYKDDPSLNNLYEAWARYRFSGATAVKVGRQALDYDNARFMGNLDWAQQGRSHDAVVFEYRRPNAGFSMDAGFTFNQADVFEPSRLTGNEYPLTGNNKTMQYVWMNKRYDNSGISLLFHNDARQVQDGPLVWRQTAGANGFIGLDDITLRGEFYYQFGEDLRRNDVSAWMANAEISYRGTYTLGADLLSGTEAGAGENNSFDPLYGTNHKFYGWMDYFYVGNGHAEPGSPYAAGLINLYQKYSRNLSPSVNLQLHLHQFISPVDIRDAQGDVMSSYLGTEADIQLTWRAADRATFIFGYSQMFKTDTLDRIKGDRQTESYNSWAWVMLRFNPTIF